MILYALHDRNPDLPVGFEQHDVFERVSKDAPASCGVIGFTVAKDDEQACIAASVIADLIAEGRVKLSYARRPTE